MTKFEGFCSLTICNLNSFKVTCGAQIRKLSKIMVKFSIQTSQLKVICKFQTYFLSISLTGFVEAILSGPMTRHKTSLSFSDLAT